MKDFIKKIVSFMMALLVLSSTFSFTVASHYCGDTLVDSSIFGHAETCGMQVKKAVSKTDCDISDKSCCTDEQKLVEGQDTLKTSFDKLEKEQKRFVAIFVSSYVQLFESEEVDNGWEKNYIPPPLVRDVQVLDQTFLI